ncbi:hypothetical protein [Amycolatopsis thermoflava]|uniref:hypothetical protein n=1 Tax=Amycolatopsis thermoflava TaxID=84480 RepID=UPI002B40011C|nr:hypothetical protein [Amycolatopsis thermoflava]
MPGRWTLTSFATVGRPPKGACRSAQPEFHRPAGFDPVYGARRLRRFIARDIETRIGRALLGGDAHAGAIIQLGLTASGLTVTYDTHQTKPGPHSPTQRRAGSPACLIRYATWSLPRPARGSGSF